VVLYEDPFTSVRGLSGGPVTSHPVPLMSYPWAQSGRFALQGIEYAFLCAQSIIEYEAVAVAKPATNQRPETQDPRPGWYSGLRP
jgi:hypothetical protein